MAVCALPELGHAQYEQHAQPDKGPRALGLLELSPGGKAHLIPIAIMYNGDFFDAGAYKANPVPMALDGGTVYEAERSGVSQGLFTVLGALENNGSFIGQGTWQDAASVAAAATAKKKEIPSEPRGIEDTSGPPRLHRSKPVPKPAPSSQTPSSTPPSAPPTSGPGSPSAGGSAPNSGNAPSSPADDRPVLKKPPSESGQSGQKDQSSAQPSAQAKNSSGLPGEASDENDPNRPRLRREKPANPPTASTPAEEQATVKKAASVESPMIAKASNVQLIPAISDAGGPSPESYVYPMKPDEEQQFRKKMLALAAENVSDYVKKWSAGVPSGAPATSSGARTRAKSKKPAVHSQQPEFSNVEMRVFDLSSSNEPTLVLTATAQLPHQTGRGQQTEELGPQYFVTLVASQDIYGDLHKIQANVTDQNHLDIAPRMEIIDAVDADGDRRGELLFRETSDRGSGFAIYRVIGYQLYELFQSTPGEQ